MKGAVRTLPPNPARHHVAASALGTLADVVRRSVAEQRRHAREVIDEARQLGAQGGGRAASRAVVTSPRRALLRLRFAGAASGRHASKMRPGTDRGRDACAGDVAHAGAGQSVARRAS